jgi:hypothetical protein
MHARDIREIMQNHDRFRRAKKIDLINSELKVAAELGKSNVVFNEPDREFIFEDAEDLKFIIADLERRGFFVERREQTTIAHRKNNIDYTDVIAGRLAVAW